MYFPNLGIKAATLDPIVRGASDCATESVINAVNKIYQSKPKFHYFFTILLFTIQAAVSSLKQEYKENETTLAEAQALAIKVLSKTLDMTKLTPEKGKYLIQIFISLI